MLITIHTYRTLKRFSLYIAHYTVTCASSSSLLVFFHTFELTSLVYCVVVIWLFSLSDGTYRDV